MPKGSSAFRRWVLLIIALGWSSAFVFCASNSQADQPPMYRMHRYQRDGARLTVFFRSPNHQKRSMRRLSLNLPISLRPGQRIADGIVSGKNCILAALDHDEEVTVYQVDLLRNAVGGSNRKQKVLSVSQRSPNESDAALFEVLSGGSCQGAAGGKSEGVVKTTEAPQHQRK